MKKLYIFAAALALTTISVNAQENLIVNGDFENWTEENPENFKKVTGGGDNPPVYNDLLVKETFYSRSGNGARQESKPQGTTQYLEYSNLIPVEAGQSYTISYWYLDNDKNASTRCWSTWLNANNQALPTGNQANIQEQSYSTDSSNWVNKVLTVTAPTGAEKIRFQIRTYHQDGAAGGYIYFDDLSFIHNGTASVGDTAIDGLKIFPNPTTNILNITTSNNNSDILVSVFDMMGKEVLNTKVVNGVINTSNLNTGIYVVKITEESNTATKKLVIK